MKIVNYHRQAGYLQSAEDPSPIVHREVSFSKLAHLPPGSQTCC